MSEARSAQDEDAVFFCRRALPQAPAEVFAAFARPERLARWWGPAGFRNTFASCDFRPGGRWTFTMHGPDGAAYPNECVFRAIEAPSRVVIDHVVAPRFTLTVELRPAGGGCELRWTQVFDDPATARRVRAIVRPANEQNLDRLQALLAGGES